MTTHSSIISDYMGRGLESAKPAPASLNVATGTAAFWWATDTGILYQLNAAGTAWQVVGGGNGQFVAMMGMDGQDGEDGMTIPSQSSGGGGGGSGTVTSINADLGLTGGTITSSGTITAQTPQPQGRLTLTSATPVMTADATAQGTIYYAEYTGNSCPVYDGTTTRPLTFSNPSLILDATNNTSGHLYDVFLWNNSGTATLGAGPAWSTATTRGVGAGTTELQLKNGIWTNKNAITLHNNSVSSGSIAVNQATYLGTFYATANAQTGMAFDPTAALGGTNNFLALYNAYNRVRITARGRDSTASWTYNVSTWRASDNSNSNRISFIDGLQQSIVEGRFQQLVNSTNAGSNIGLNLDSTSATPVTRAGSWGGTGNPIPTTANDRWAPQLGFHYIQAMEFAGGAPAVQTFYGAGNDHTILVSLDM